MARPRKAGWFLESAILTHWRLEVAGAAGFGVWALACAWSDEHLTDGHIPIAKAKALVSGARAALPRVTRSGLWSACTEHDECFLIHRYTEDGRGRKRQPKKEEIEGGRAAARTRMQALRSGDVRANTDRTQREHGPNTDRTEVPLDTTSSLQVPPLYPPHGGEPPQPAARKTTPRRRGVPLPDDWKPTAAHGELAKGLGLDVDFQAQRFRDWAAHKGKTGLDWNAGFRNWLTSPFAQAQQRAAAARPADRPTGPMKDFN